MASPALGAVAAVGSAKTPLQLAGTPQLKVLVQEAAYLHGVSVSTLLRRALVSYVDKADGIPPDLAKAIEEHALRRDRSSRYGAPVYRPEVAALIAELGG